MPLLELVCGKCDRRMWIPVAGARFEDRLVCGPIAVVPEDGACYGRAEGEPLLCPYHGPSMAYWLEPTARTMACFRANLQEQAERERHHAETFDQEGNERMRQFALGRVSGLEEASDRLRWMLDPNTDPLHGLDQAASEARA